jgi:cysteine desulfurase/selenocysteine lyase
VTAGKKEALERPKRRSWTAESIRGEFPILSVLVRGKPLVYLDNAATTQKPQAVLDVLDEYYEGYNANIHRGIHQLSEKATLRYEEAREKVRRFLGARAIESIVFTRGTTESINLVRYAWGRKNIRQGDEIVLTVMEHHSNLVPWQLLAKEAGATLRFVPATKDGLLDLDALRGFLQSGRVKLVAFTHCSNVLGTLNPADEICRIAREHGAATLVDGAQSAPHMTVDVERIGCDFFAFSGHKMAGPTGVGALYGRREVLDAMDPFLGGGEMISSVTWDVATWNQLPWKFEAGTMMIAQAIGLGAAIDYLTALGMDEVRAHEQRITAYALARLREIGVRIYGPERSADRGGVIAFDVDGVHPHDLAQLLDQDGIAIRAGHHCAQPLTRQLGVAATARASFFVYNTEAEVDALAQALVRARDFFKGA